MKCPVDGGEMGQAAAVGIDNSYRCGSCGGVWAEAWVVNSLAEGKELRVTRYEIRDKIQDTGPLLCPEEGAKLARAEGENLPGEVELWKCEKCKKWWLPGNAIFDLAGAFAIKREYLKTWKRKNDLSAFALPVVLTLVLIAGLGMILNQVRLRQLWQTQAAIVRSTNVRYLGDERAEIKLMVTGDLGVVEFRLEGETDWQQAVVVSQGEWQVAIISGVTPGQKFLLRWNKGVVQMTVGQQE